MKIIKLKAENVKKIKAIEINPDGNTVVISGKNGAGKSSVLDAIFYALCGNDTAHTKKPIRDGQDKAFVKVDLGDYIVTRNWTGNDKSYLKVESKDGAKYPNPQTLLNKIIGKLSFDPLEFCNLNEKEQVKTLLSLVDLEAVLKEIDDKKKEVYEQRTFVNRDVSQIEVRVRESEKLSPDLSLPGEEIQGADISTRIKQAQAAIKENNEKRNRLNKLKESHKRLVNTRKSLGEKIKELQIELDRSVIEINDICAKYKALLLEVNKLTDPDIDKINEEFVALQETNKQIRIANQYRELLSDLEAKRGVSKELTEEIGTLEEKKKAALKAAKFPVEGLSFNDTGVTYNNIPFRQCSTSERLRVSVAMAMALNPKLRVIRIMDGSLLDTESMEIIKYMARDNDFQVWVEVVNDSGKVGIYIEDGEIRKDGEA